MTSKRLIAATVIVGMIAMVLALPAPAHARGGRFVGGLAVGAVTGLVLGGLFAPRVYAAPPVVYQPAPVYVQPAPVYVQPAPVYAEPPAVVYQPAPVYVAPRRLCSDYWIETHWNGYAWVGGHWARSCR